jgi:antitoxin FitA
MSQLIVRNIPESLVSKLRRRAAENGVSAEEQHRRILRESLEGGTGTTKSFKDHLLSLEDTVEDFAPTPRSKSNRRLPQF